MYDKPDYAHYWRYVDDLEALDSWYALNNSNGNSGAGPVSDFPYAPFRTYPARRGAGGEVDWKIHKLTDLRPASEVAMVFDGVHSASAMGNTVSTRHRNRKFANVVLADGHAESVHISRFPQTDDDVYAPHAFPRFRLRPGDVNTP